MKERICKDCHISFAKKQSKKGFFNQCDECSDADSTHRYIGYNDGSLNKSTHISVYRGKDKNVLKALKKKQPVVG